MSNTYETPSELITQLMDGEISAQQSETLYASLATDKELMNELQQHIAIRETVRKDLEAFTPPVATTNAIFSKLGYNAPGNGHPTNHRKVPAVWHSWFKKSFVPVAVTILAVIAFVNSDSIGSNSIINNSNESFISANTSNSDLSNVNANLNSDNQIINALVASKNNTEKSVPIVKSSELINNSKNINSISESNSQTLNNNNTQIDNIVSSLTENSLNRISNEIVANSMIVPSNNKFIINNNYSINSLKLFQNNFDNSYKEFSIFVNGYSSLKRNSSTLSSGQISNLSIGFVFGLKNNFSFGIESGLQNYWHFTTDVNSSISKIQTQSSVFSIAAIGKYNFGELSFADIIPYSQIGLGGSTLGFLAKGSIGINYCPDIIPIGINLGYEYSNIWYSLSPDNAEKINFSTNNSGFVFGINYKF